MFAAREHGILADGGEKSGVRVEGRFPPQGGAEVVAEAVDVEFFDPVAQAVEHPAQDVRFASI